MPAFFCTICGDPVVEGSKLCAQHHTQAARFSTVFGTGASTTPCPPEGSSEPNAEPSQKPASPEALLKELQHGLDDILAWARGPGTGAERWPQLALYYLRGALKHRRFYGVMPTLGSADMSFPLTREVLGPALEADSPVVQSLLKILAERKVPLEHGEVEMLFLDIKPHDNMISLGAVMADKTRQTLNNFVYYDGRFVAA